MRDEVFSEELPCQLTERERTDRGRQLARKSVELTRHEDFAKDEKKKLADVEKKLTKETKKLARIVDSGEEHRLVECYHSPNKERFEIDTVRIDTGEVVRSRPMDPSEKEDTRQGKLFEMNTEIMRAHKDASTSDRVAKSEKKRGRVLAVAVDAEADKPAQRARDQKRAHDKAKAKAKAPNVAELVPEEKDDDAPRGSIDNANPLPQPIPPHRDDQPQES